MFLIIQKAFGKVNTVDQPLSPRRNCSSVDTTHDGV